MTSLQAEVTVPGRLATTRIEAKAGERIAVIGPNGSGKTSLLRAIAGIAGSGEVSIAGERLSKVPPPRRARLLSYLPASREVTWPIAVRDVVALGLTPANPPRVSALLDALWLRSLADRAITDLSTGERARALLARALAPEPPLLLLDEPLSNLDPAWVLRTLDLIDRVAASGTTVLLALHDLALLDRFDRVLLLDRGQLVGDGRPDEVLRALAFREAFAIVPTDGGWALSPSEDPRSSP